MRIAVLIRAVACLLALFLCPSAVHARLAGPWSQTAKAEVAKVDEARCAPKVAATSGDQDAEAPASLLQEKHHHMRGSSPEQAAVGNASALLQSEEISGHDNSTNTKRRPRHKLVTEWQSYVLERRSAATDNSTHEEERSGEKYLALFRDSAETLCTSATASSPEGLTTITRYSTAEEPCDQGKGEMAVLQRAVLENSEAGPSLRVPCQEAAPLDAQISAYARGNISLVPAMDEFHDTAQCSVTVAEDTILVLNPRDEAFGGVFHNLEEAFGMMQSADILQKPMNELRLLLVYSAPGSKKMSLLQFNGQLANPLSLEETFSEADAPKPHQLLQPLVDVFSHLVKGGPVLEALPSSLPVGGRLCFQGKVVLPMRACSGEVLTRTWSQERSVHRYNTLAMRYVNYIMSRFSCEEEVEAELPQKGPGVKKVQWMSRHSSHGRNIPEAVEEELKRRLREEMGHPVIVDSVEFANLSMAEQICRIKSADLLVGVHGSGLTHMMYLPPGAGVLEITPYVVPMPYWSYGNFPMNLAKWTNHSYKAVQTAAVEGYYVQFDLDDVIAYSRELLGGPASLDPPAVVLQ